MRFPSAIRCSSICVLLSITANAVLAFSQPMNSKSEIPVLTWPPTRQHIIELYSPDPEARAGAIQSLIEHPGMGRPAVPFLVGMLGDNALYSFGHGDFANESLIGDLAASAIVSINSSDSLELLRSALKNGNVDIRCRVVRVMSKLKDNVRAVPDLIGTLKSDSDDTVKIAAARSLGDLGNKSASADLYNATGMASRELRVVAACAITSMWRPGEPVEFVTPLLSNQDTSVRLRAIEAIGGRGGEGALTILIPLLNDVSPEVRASAAEGVGLACDPLRDASIYEATTPPLLRLLSDSDPQVVLNALRALSDISDSKVTAPSNQANQLQFLPLRATAAPENPLKGDVLSGVIRLVDDQREPIRQAATTALGAIDKTWAIRSISELLSNPGARGRESALQRSLQELTAAGPEIGRSRGK